MGTDQLIRGYLDELWVKQNLDVIDELVAEDFIDHTDPPESGSARDALRAIAKKFRSDARDVSLTIDVSIEGQNEAAVFWTMEWTQTGDFFGAPADGRRLALHGGHFYRIRNGKLAEIWHSEDYQRLYGTLGWTFKP